MATISWRTDRTVKQLLLAQYGSFDSFQLLRLVQWPAASQVAESGNPLQLRFRADLSAGFAGHEFSSLRCYSTKSRFQGEHEVIEIKTPNYCIASLLGPLPEPFTEWVRDLKRARSSAMADFLDMFNHRLNLVRYQLKSRQTLALNNLPPDQTEHATQLAAIMGMGLSQLAQQIALPKRSWLGLAGLLANCRKSTAAISQVLTLYLGVKVSLTPLVGAWANIEPEECIGLGRRNHALGRQSVLGQKVWNQSARIRLSVAALDYQRFCQLLPPNHPQHGGVAAVDSAPYFGLLSLLRLLLNGLHDCEVQLHLREESVPPARLLSRANRSNIGLRLSHSAWMGGQGSAPSRPVCYLIPAFANTEQV